MRLLERLPNGDIYLTERFLSDLIPPYAILSHTWGDSSQEVTFEDMVGNSGPGKAGYKKIEFCADQAANDGFKHIWVDSCCIKKSDDSELSESLRSMYRWYYRAEKCYVYLSDVSTKKRKRRDDSTQSTWEQSFGKSRWFTRGWTLQELLAPSLVEFFSEDGKRLGDKRSLEGQIHEITGIPISALRGSALSQFATDQKFNWAKNRQTTREEDQAYSLFGIFGVSMPVMYGEGREDADRRLRKEIDGSMKSTELKDKDCLRDLHVTDPRDDKTRIEQTKGGLSADVYHWILENDDFKQWRHNQQSQLLWIKGDPGKGKTMLLCGIIDDLKKSKSQTHVLSYFFCQASDSRINNATAVLRGLLYLVIHQQPWLITHIQKPHDHAGRSLFEDANAWTALSDIFMNVLQDSRLESSCLIIDALDECTTGLPQLLDFIQKSSLSAHVKWLVSSRNWPTIEERLKKAGNKLKLCLELNEKSISQAVSIYIQSKVGQLARDKEYDKKTQKAVLNHLASKANNTFLWVALVYQFLQEVDPWNVIARLNEFPPGLDPLYGRMMAQIDSSHDADLCRRILGSMAIVYRPVTLKELTSLIDMPENISANLKWLTRIIQLCGSFLTIRNDIIYLIHQSAQDFLLTNISNPFSPGKEKTHHEIFLRSLKVLRKTLQRDMYNLNSLGLHIEQVQQPNPDPLAASRYSCTYWVDHLCESNPYSHVDHKVDLQDGGIVDVFLKEKYLYWLEALSLSSSMSDGVLAMAKLKALMEVIQTSVVVL
jgi:hypothetical protein